MSTATVIFQKGFRKAVVKGNMVVRVAISGTSFVDSYITPPVSTKAAVPTSKQNVSFIKRTALAYTEHKQNAKVYVISGVKKGAAIMDNPEKAVRNKKGEATVHSRGYVEHILNLDLFDDDVEDIEFHLDHTPNNKRKIEANVNSRGYIPHELNWDEEEVF